MLWNLERVYMRTQFLFSSQGLFFLSGAWISGSDFSFSSMYDFITSIDFESGQRSIFAWNCMLEIWSFKLSRSIIIYDNLIFFVSIINLITKKVFLIPLASCINNILIKCYSRINKNYYFNIIKVINFYKIK